MATARRRSQAKTKRPTAKTKRTGRARASSPRRQSKADLLDALGRKLTRDELVSLNAALEHGYKPFVPTPDEIDAGAMPGWTAPGVVEG